MRRTSPAEPVQISTCAYRKPRRFRALTSLVILLGAASCSTNRWNPSASFCKNHAYVNVGVEDYLSTRFPSSQHSRAAFTAFEVPENFAAPGREQGKDIGKQLGIQLQHEFQKTGVVDVAEFFNEVPWPGRREDFESGNYGWIERARNAGYDVLFLGYLQPIRTTDQLTLSTKIIDVKNHVTIWSADTSLAPQPRKGGAFLRALGLAKEQTELHINERLQHLVSCAAQKMLQTDPTP